ncbi:lipoprotein insertase outer membrane protein LolB [Legionella sp.]|uniref:lipoprotein insertase outer membrane protein LolB n=1 Tax=Legionella sp. TaxID=459 RepID=UPI003CB47F5E
MNNLKRFIIIPIYLLTACAPPKPLMETQQVPTLNQPPTLNKVISVKQRKEKTNTITSWEISGALAAKNKSKGWSASMNWVQNGPEAYHIRLIGPLGAGTVLINKHGNTITFQDGPKKISSSNADELLLQQTGIRLPVNNLFYWIRGLPAPSKVSSEQRDQYNHLVQLRQNGYTITFGNYTSVKGVDLPKIIRLDGNGVMVKVIIKNWSV